MSTILELFFPCRCAACAVPLQVDGVTLCPACQKDVTPIKQPFCCYCGVGKEVGEGVTICTDCLLSRPKYRQARAYFAYQGVVRHLLQRFKFEADFIAYAALVELVKSSCNPLPTFYDYIIPVPLHKSRLRKRGFNQAWLLAKLFFPNHVGLRANVLSRIEATVPQMSLPKDSRRKNVREAFAVNYDLGGRVVCLVDDVLTTGSTVEECTRVLLRAGAEVVDVLVLARVGHR